MPNPSVQPYTATAFSALIWEFDPNASALGPNPIGAQPPMVEQPIIAKRLARALQTLRERIIPRVWNSLNLSMVNVIHRSEANISGSNGLGKRTVETSEAIYVVIGGPTAEMLEKGLLTVDDYECIIPCFTLNARLTEEDAIEIDGIYYDIVGVQDLPKVPEPVAYRYQLKRTAAE